ncbi:hypothetical protein QAD02_018531 [Eretmocerus hayati]|uniref:Uncharacterized protein n=1 Tax=Eretmocerus hayati TaxID=131215 RepID=A0ACC2PHE7_9HYME|nr:hypothetical protein QAD02_018531 [Eretmocerus hayati]
MKRIALALCLLAVLQVEAANRGRGQALRARSRQLRRGDDPAYWESQHNLNNAVEPAINVESRQYGGYQGGYGGSAGGYPGQGGSGGYPGQGGSGGYPGQGGSGGYPGQGGSGGSGNKPGKPQRPPGCLADRGQFPSPKSCASYLNCWDDVAVEQHCPAGLLFNEKRQYCDFPYNVQCGNRPRPTQKPTQTSKRCPEPNGWYRNPTNCSEFYVCVNGNPVKFNCPEGLAYSEDTKICDYPEKVDCKGAAAPRPLPSTTTTEAPAPAPTRPNPRPTRPTPTTQQPDEPNPNPPYNPDEAELPAPINPYQPANSFLIRTKPEQFWQQRHSASASSAAASEIDIQKEVDQDVQASQQVEDEEYGTTTSQPQAESWKVSYDVPSEYLKTPCTNGEVHPIDEKCSSVVVCRKNVPQVINCPGKSAYDRPTDSCLPSEQAKWTGMAFSIEALQSKSKLNNERLRRAERVLQPELMRLVDNEDEDAEAHQHHRIGNIVSTFMYKLRHALGPHHPHQMQHRDEGDLSQVIVSDHINPEGQVRFTYYNNEFFKRTVYITTSSHSVLGHSVSSVKLNEGSR